MKHVVSHINIPNHEKIFCYLQKDIVPVDKILVKCKNCKYFYGLGQGLGIECSWEDTVQGNCVTVPFPTMEKNRVLGSH